MCLVLLSVGMLSSCGVGSNQEACESYVEQVNAVYADCDLDPPFDVDSTCPASLNEGGDCTALYECLGEAYQCTPDGVLYDVADCSCAG